MKGLRMARGFTILIAFLLCFFAAMTILSGCGEDAFNKSEIVSTSLPTMFINLYDENDETVDLKNVTKENYIRSTIAITNTDEKYCISDVEAEFKGRGNGSWGEDKKGYKIKFKKKTSLFGRTKNKHWVLNACANGQDKTMYQNYLAYNLASTVLDGIEYTTNAVWVDVYVNNLYHGVYVLCEHVRVDTGRVDIDSEYGVLDTGYLIEYDAYATGVEGVDYFRIDGVKYPFTVHSPDPEEYEKGTTLEQYKEQVAYIKNYVQNVYTSALQKDFETFSSLADINSFVDMYLLHELFKNTDTGFSSFYLYKKAGGKLYAGPAWDFDLSAVKVRGDNSPEGLYVADKVLEKSDFTASELYISLYKTDGFKDLVVNRWKQISQSVKEFFDSNMNKEVYDKNLLAMSRNLSLWYKLDMDKASKEWLKEVGILKNWFDKRIEFLNREWD